MDIHIVSTYDEFYSLKSDWNSLLERSGSDSICLTHEWLDAWWRAYGPGREHQPMVVVLKNADRIEVIAPLMIEHLRLRRYVPYRRIVFLGHPYVEFMDFLIGGDRAEAFRRIKEVLDRMAFGELLLRYIPDYSPNFDYFRSWSEEVSSARFTEQTHCLSIDLPRSWDEFSRQSSIRNNLWPTIRRLTNRYKELSSWSVEEIHEWNDSLLDDMAVLHEASQTRKQRQSVYRTPPYRKFMQHLIQHSSRDIKFESFFLNMNGRREAFFMGFVYRGVFYYWNTGFNMNVEKLAPSKFLMWNVLRDKTESAQWKNFNFMGGIMPYKKQWSNSMFRFYILRILHRKGVWGLVNRVRKA